MDGQNNKKLIICIRHGERSDHVGLEPQLGPCDPELTENGCHQAFSMGQIIQKELNDIHKDLSGKILVISSPFARTLQTSQGVISGLKTSCKHNNLNEVHVDHLLSEYIIEKLIEKLPTEYLNLYNNDNFLPNYIQSISLKYLNSKEELPKEQENYDTCQQRVKNCLDIIIKNVLFNEDVSVVILVSHGSPLDHLNQILGYPGPYGWHLIDYCNSYFYSLNTDNNSTEFLYKKTLKEFI